jgi:replicative DNA helicase
VPSLWVLRRSTQRRLFLCNVPKPNGDDDAKFAIWSKRAEELHNVAEVMIAKHRHGPVDSFELLFEPEQMRFSCFDRRHSRATGR